MPAIQSGKILVSGANGFVAVWVVKAYLDAGFSVRGTVRSEKAVPFLKETFKSFGDKFELVIVPDITVDGAFDEAVKGVDAIAHTASPFHFAAVEPKDIIDPAVRGTVSILESARKYGSDVKRVVITSSVASVMESSGYEGGPRYTEADWNTRSAANCDALGKDAHPADKYFASKVLAERAAWQFEKDHKSELKFDFVAINPDFVHGPFLHDVPSPDKLNTSLASLYNAVIKRGVPKEQLGNPSGAWVDVRNVAEAHLKAITLPEAAGERFILDAGSFTWQEWVHYAHVADPSLDAGLGPDFDFKSVTHPFTFENKKSREVLGIKYITSEQSIKDSLEQFKKLGWY